MKIWHLAPRAQGYLKLTQRLETIGVQVRTGMHAPPPEAPLRVDSCL